MSSLLLLFYLLAISGTHAQFNEECPPEPSTLPSGLVLEVDSACQISLALQTNEDNPDYLNIYLQGTATGWVALGFSKGTGKNKMAFSDVIGCKRDDSGDVGVLDSWNVEQPALHNEADPNQDGVCNYRSEYKDGKFSCLFSRYYAILNEGFDYNWNESFYLLLGCSENTYNLTENFPYHRPHIPVATTQMYIPMSYNTSNTSSGTVEKPVFERRMIRAHGILMVIAYPLLLVTGIFFAAWMKPALPKMWIQIHRALNMISLGIALVAFMLIFVANKDNSPTPGIINLHDCGAKTTHFVFGIAAVFLHLINPILSFVRCKPDSPNRWIFNLAHGAGIGLLAELLALINIALGAIIFQSNCGKVDSNNIMLWLYIAWFAALILIQLFLFIYFTVKAIQGDVESAPLLVKLIMYIPILPYGKYFSLNKDSDENSVTKEENAVRYGVFGFQLGLSLLITLVLIVFIAVDNFY